MVRKRRTASVQPNRKMPCDSSMASNHERTLTLSRNVLIAMISKLVSYERSVRSLPLFALNARRSAFPKGNVEARIGKEEDEEEEEEDEKTIKRDDDEEMSKTKRAPTPTFSFRELIERVGWFDAVDAHKHFSEFPQALNRPAN